MQPKFSKAFFSVILVLLILQVTVVLDSSAQTSEKTTYYVAPNGDDANAGTISQPWRTIQHAADTMVAGDTVLIRSGVYNEQIRTVSDGNAADGYITFSAYPDETPVIDGTGVETGNNGVVIDNSYIKISGFEIRNWNDGGISVWTAGFIEISDCKIHDIGGAIGFFDGSHDFTVNRVEMYQILIGGFDASPGEGADCYNGVISDCVVHNAQDPEQNSDGFALGHGGEHNFVFNRCEAYNVWDGFDISAHDVQINSCSSHDNYNVGYKLWDDNITLTNCLGYNTETSNLQLTWREKPGTVTLQNCNFMDSLGNDNIWVQNPARHLHMYNCILSGGDNVGLDFEQLGTDTYQGDYNIFHNDNPDRMIVVRDTNAEFSLNMISAGDWNSYSSQDQHSIVCTDPASQLFTNSANHDFHLKQGSIAIDAGTQNNAPQTDYDGVSRPQGGGYDIGAYEYTTSSSPNNNPHSGSSENTQGTNETPVWMQWWLWVIVAAGIFGLAGVAFYLFKIRKKA
jgi:hypothetical protein